jgi:hypothetical protein
MNDCLHARTPVHLLISRDMFYIIWCDTESMLHRSEAEAEAEAEAAIIIILSYYYQHI